MPAFRIDILVRDPTIPTVSFAYRGLHYRDLNRIIRFDATSTEQPLELLFIPEGGAAPFDPPVIEGGTLTLQVPGRLLLGEVGDDLGKLDLTEMRWTVVVRDMDTCDFLAGDDGRPSRPLETTPPAEVAGLVAGQPHRRDDGRRRIVHDLDRGWSDGGVPGDRCGSGRGCEAQANYVAAVTPCSRSSSASRSSTPAEIFARHHA